MTVTSTHFIMRSILRTLLMFCLPAIAGCIAFVPVAELMPSTTGGTIHTSNCMGTRTVRYDFDGVPIWVSVRSNGPDTPPSRLTMGLILAEGHIARIPAPVIRIKPLDERPEESHPLTAWERSVLRRIKPQGSRLERVIVETGPAAGPLVGGTPHDGDDVVGHATAKAFSISIPLAAPPAPGYRVQLPSIEIDGKVHTFAPIEYRLQYRVEFMVPLNC